MDQPDPGKIPPRAEPPGAVRGAGFPLFTILFVAFVGLHLLWPELMARPLRGELGGLLVSMILGIAVILAAMVLGMSGGRR